MPLRDDDVPRVHLAYFHALPPLPEVHLSLKNVILSVIHWTIILVVIFGPDYRLMQYFDRNPNYRQCLIDIVVAPAFIDTKENTTSCVEVLTHRMNYLQSEEMTLLDILGAFLAYFPLKYTNICIALVWIVIHMCVRLSIFFGQF